MSNSTPQTIKYTELMEVGKRFFKYFLSQYKFILVVTIITSVLGLVYGKLQPSSYTATATFIVDEKGGSKSGGLSGLASQFGIDMGSITGGSGGLFDGDNILEIMKSRRVIESVLLSNVEDAISEKGLTIADFYLKNSPLGAALATKNITTANLGFAKITEDSKHSIVQDSVLYMIYVRIKKDLNVEKQNKKSTIITLGINSPSQVFSKTFVEKLLKKTSEMYIEIKTGNLTENINKMQKKADSLYNILSSTGDRRNYINLSIPNEGMSRDKSVASGMFGDVAKNIESMKLSLINQTPVIQILDGPKYPLLDKRTPARYFLLIGFAIGIGFSLAVSLYKYTA